MPFASAATRAGAHCHESALGTDGDSGIVEITAVIVARRDTGASWYEDAAAAAAAAMAAVEVAARLENIFAGLLCMSEPRPWPPAAPAVVLMLASLWDADDDDDDDAAKTAAEAAAEVAAAATASSAARSASAIAPVTFCRVRSAVTSAATAAATVGHTSGSTVGARAAAARAPGDWNHAAPRVNSAGAAVALAAALVAAAAATAAAAGCIVMPPEAEPTFALAAAPTPEAADSEPPLELLPLLTRNAAMPPLPAAAGFATLNEVEPVAAAGSRAAANALDDGSITCAD